MQSSSVTRESTALAFAQQIRAHFPLLANDKGDQVLAYLDTAATALKPYPVVEAMRGYYETYSANVHRGLYALADQATRQFESARITVASFINAASESEIIFTRGATDALNTVALSLSQEFLTSRDLIAVSELEHHSNLVPWQIAAQRTGCSLRRIQLLPDGNLDIDELERNWDDRIKLVTVTHMSNVQGSIQDIRRIAELVHRHGGLVVVDGAQSIAHTRIDVKALDCDFFAFSAHKLYGPTGCGVLYGKKSLLEKMPPVQGGGNMISTVHFDRYTCNELPNKFEAGTPPIAEAIGLAAAVDFVLSVGFDVIADHEAQLTTYALARFRKEQGITIYGPHNNRGPVISFTLDVVHPHDVAQFLDSRQIAIRAGHHCAQPLMRRLGVAALARASFGMYTTHEEIDRLIVGLRTVREYFS